VEFTGITGGTSIVSLSNVLLLDSALSPISVSVANGSVTVQGVPEPATSGQLGMGLFVLVFVAGQRWLGSRALQKARLSAKSGVRNNRGKGRLRRADMWILAEEGDLW